MIGRQADVTRLIRLRELAAADRAGAIYRAAHCAAAASGVASEDCHEQAVAAVYRHGVRDALGMSGQRVRVLP